MLTQPTRLLEGSCQCGAVEFSVESHTPVPYQLCACSICRKCGGYNGSVNLGGINDSLKVMKGKDMIKYLPFPPLLLTKTTISVIIIQRQETS
jgi:hypothetical protein